MQPVKLFSVSILLSLSILALPLPRAYALLQDQRPSSHPTPPKLLLLVQKDSKQPTSNLPQLIGALLKRALRNSPLYSPILYSPYDPQVKQGLINHTLQPGDLEALNTQPAQQRLAQAYDANYLLVVQPHIASETVQLDLSLLRHDPSGSWSVPYSNQISVSMPPTRKGVTPEVRQTALLYALVDTTTGAIGSPSRLLDTLPITLPRPIALANQPSANAQKASTPPSTPTEAPAQAEPSPQATQQNQPVATPPPNYFAQAMDALRDGKMASAVMLLRQAIDADPLNPTPRVLLTQTYLQMHLVSLAAASAQSSVQLCPNNIPLLQMEARVLQAQGDTKTALKLFQHLVEQNPNNIEARLALADALLADGQYAEAQQAYEQAAQLDPKNAQPALRLAALFIQEAKSDATYYAKSLEKITQARQLLPPNDTTTYLTAYLHFMPILSQQVRDSADALQHIYEACVQGSLQTTQALRNVDDLQNRLSAITNFLSKLPTAVGEEKAQAAYGQSAALLLQAVDYFHDVLSDPARTPREAGDTLALARANTLHALQEADNLLQNQNSPNSSTPINPSNPSSNS